MLVHPWPPYFRIRGIFLQTISQHIFYSIGINECQQRRFAAGFRLRIGHTAQKLPVLRVIQWLRPRKTLPQLVLG
jgi:hypothetical protein